MGLEEALYGSAAIRNFLKLFSEQHEKRVSKATFLIGIPRLAELAERKGKQSIANLNVDDIEKLAIKVHERYVRQKRAQTAGDNIIPIYQNLNTSEKKQQKLARRRKEGNRYRNGHQFLSTSSSHHLQDSSTVLQDSEVAKSYPSPQQRLSSAKRRAASSSFDRKRRQDENDQQLGEHLAGYRNTSSEAGNNDNREGSIGKLRHLERHYTHH